MVLLDLILALVVAVGGVGLAALTVLALKQLNKKEERTEK